jgi:hypothetical protein
MGAPPESGFLALDAAESGVEAYGESPGKLLYSASYDQDWERAAVLAAAELRLPEEFRPLELAAILPSPRRALPAGELSRSHVFAYLAALAAACPRLALSANLLPAAQRSTSSRLIYVPSAMLGMLMVLGLGALGLYQRYEDRNYLDAVNAEVRTLEPGAARLQQLDAGIAKLRERVQLLDGFLLRTRSDLDALGEVTRLVAPPAWLNTLELGRASLVVAGEADQATGLLKALDGSPQFQNSEFLVPLSRIGNVEVFRIRAGREGAPQ